VHAQAWFYASMSKHRRPSRPRDPNELAKLIADIATGDVVEPAVTDDGRDIAAVLLGRRGGLKGGAGEGRSVES